MCPVTRLQNGCPTGSVWINDVATGVYDALNVQVDLEPWQDLSLIVRFKQGFKVAYKAAATKQNGVAVECARPVQTRA